MSFKLQPPNIPKKYQPRGFTILHEDPDIIVVNKQAGTLSVAALWEKEQTVHGFLNTYVRKGNPMSKKEVFPVHRLDQATSGVLIFAKSPQVQDFLKSTWTESEKIYYAIAHGRLEKKSGLIESFLSEDENYVVHSSKYQEDGKLARTEYAVVHETEKLSILKIKLLTGKKNQIRVHFADLGHPIVGDTKYGPEQTPFRNLLLHAFSLTLTHPFKKERVRFQADLPKYFNQVIDYKY